jgi:hypothetical protein
VGLIARADYYVIAITSPGIDVVDQMPAIPPQRPYCLRGGPFAQFERRLTSQRTKDALAVKKAQGVRLGRPAPSRRKS